MAAAPFTQHSLIARPPLVLCRSNFRLGAPRGSMDEQSDQYDDGDGGWEPALVAAGDQEEKSNSNTIFETVFDGLAGWRPVQKPSGFCPAGDGSHRSEEHT